MLCSNLKNWDSICDYHWWLETVKINDTSGMEGSTKILRGVCAAKIFDCKWCCTFSPCTKTANFSKCKYLLKNSHTLKMTDVQG